MEEVGKRLKGCIWERNKGFTTWVRFGEYSFKCLLTRIEECERAYRKSEWPTVREEEGRKYRMERRSNKAGSFLLCSMRDIGRKSFSIAIPEGRGIIGGWRLLSGKLRKIGVELKKGKPSAISTRELTKQPRHTESGTKSFVEILKTETVSRGTNTRIEVEENEVGERLRELDYFLVGRWRGGSNPSQDLKTMRNLGKF